jgi:hypothetical protein
VRYTPPPGVEDDPNAPIGTLSELLGLGYSSVEFHIGYFVANRILWASPLNLHRFVLPRLGTEDSSRRFGEPVSSVALPYG